MSVANRLDRIREAMTKAKLDALLISSPVEDSFGRNSQNRRYVSGFTGSWGYALVTKKKAMLAIDFRYVEQASSEAPPFGFDTWKTEGKMQKWVPKLIADAGLTGKRVGVSGADMSVGSFDAWQRSVRKMKGSEQPRFVPASGIVEKLRRQKDADELAHLQRAIDLADQAFDEVSAHLVPGTTETEVARRIERAIIAKGGDGVSFETIVAAGRHSAMPHASPRDVPIEPGQPVVIDMGALAGGYCSDLTRTFTLGPSDAKFKELYGIVYEAQQNAIANIEPGMKCTKAHEFAQTVIRRAGYDKQFGHGLGHGVGLQIHESPYLGKTSEDRLEEGMVFTIEPGIYIPGWGGIRIEDVVVLENGRARVLSHARKLTPAGVSQ